MSNARANHVLSKGSLLRSLTPPPSSFFPSLRESQSCLSSQSTAQISIPSSLLKPTLIPMAQQQQQQQQQRTLSPLVSQQTQLPQQSKQQQQVPRQQEQEPKSKNRFLQLIIDGQLGQSKVKQLDENTDPSSGINSRKSMKGNSKNSLAAMMKTAVSPRSSQNSVLPQSGSQQQAIYQMNQQNGTFNDITNNSQGAPGIRTVNTDRFESLNQSYGIPSYFKGGTGFIQAGEAEAAAIRTRSRESLRGQLLQKKQKESGLRAGDKNSDQVFRLNTPTLGTSETRSRQITEPKLEGVRSSKVKSKANSRLIFVNDSNDSFADQKTPTGNGIGGRVDLLQERKDSVNRSRVQESRYNDKQNLGVEVLIELNKKQLSRLLVPIEGKQQKYNQIKQSQSQQEYQFMSQKQQSLNLLKQRRLLSSMKIYFESSPVPIPTGSIAVVPSATTSTAAAGIPSYASATAASALEAAVDKAYGGKEIIPNQQTKKTSLQKSLHLTENSKQQHLPQFIQQEQYQSSNKSELITEPLQYQQIPTAIANAPPLRGSAGTSLLRLRTHDAPHFDSIKANQTDHNYDEDSMQQKGSSIKTDMITSAVRARVDSSTTITPPSVNIISNSTTEANSQESQQMIPTGATMVLSSTSLLNEDKQASSNTQQSTNQHPKKVQFDFYKLRSYYGKKYENQLLRKLPSHLQQQQPLRSNDQESQESSHNQLHQPFYRSEIKAWENPAADSDDLEFTSAHFAAH